MRLPPNFDPEKAIQMVKSCLEVNPIYNCQVEFTPNLYCSGWAMSDMDPTLKSNIKKASEEVFGCPAKYVGCGGSLPIINMIANQYPNAQIIVTGALGPGSNAHGPNEKLNLKFAEKVILCLTKVLAA